MATKPKLYKSKLKANIAHLPFQIGMWTQRREYDKAANGIKILQESKAKLAAMEEADGRRGA